MNLINIINNMAGKSGAKFPNLSADAAGAPDGAFRAVIGRKCADENAQNTFVGLAGGDAGAKQFSAGRFAATAGALAGEDADGDMPVVLPETMMLMEALNLLAAGGLMLAETETAHVMQVETAALTDANAEAVPAEDAETVPAADAENLTGTGGLAGSSVSDASPNVGTSENPAMYSADAPGMAVPSGANAMMGAVVPAPSDGGAVPADASVAAFTGRLPTPGNTDGTASENPDVAAAPETGLHGPALQAQAPGAASGAPQIEPPTAISQTLAQTTGENNQTIESGVGMAASAQSTSEMPASASAANPLPVGEGAPEMRTAPDVNMSRAAEVEDMTIPRNNVGEGKKFDIADAGSDMAPKAVKQSPGMIDPESGATEVMSDGRRILPRSPDEASVATDVMNNRLERQSPGNIFNNAATTVTATAKAAANVNTTTTTAKAAANVNTNADVNSDARTPGQSMTSNAENPNAVPGAAVGSRTATGLESARPDEITATGEQAAQLSDVPTARVRLRGRNAAGESVASALSRQTSGKTAPETARAVRPVDMERGDLEHAPARAAPPSAVRQQGETAVTPASAASDGLDARDVKSGVDESRPFADALAGEKAGVVLPAMAAPAPQPAQAGDFTQTLNSSAMPAPASETAAAAAPAAAAPMASAALAERVERLRDLLETLDEHVMQAIGDKDKSMVIRLVPANLGRVQLNCHTENDRIRVEMVVENGSVQNLIQQQESMLRGILQQAGYRMDQFDVRTQQEDTASRSPGGRTKAGGRKSGRAPAIASAASADETTMRQVGAVGYRHHHAGDGLWFVA